MMFFLLFVLGLCVGSFLNVLIDRLPKGQDVIRGRSHCDWCRHTLQWFELIPLLSFFLQRGRSRCCKKKLSLQYPLVEVTTAIGFVSVYGLGLFPMVSGSVLSIAPDALRILLCISSVTLLSSFIVIFVSDLKYEIIPLEMIILGVFAGLCLYVLRFTNFTSVPSFLFSAFFSGLFFFGLWVITKGKAMGDGDIYLASLLGFLLGYPDIIIALYAAFLTGAIAGVILILGKKRSLKSHIPFGPFLVWGYVVTLVWGNQILRIWSSVW